MSVASRQVYAAILAGGSGERLWPLSRQRSPKPLLRLNGSQSLLDETIARVATVVPRRRMAVIATLECVSALRRACRSARRVHWLAEPSARNTAMCVGLAAVWAARQDPAGIIVTLPADHQIHTRRQFAQALRRAIAVAGAREAMVLLGLRPTRPATAYGYMQRGAVLAPRVYRVAAFREKPSAARARTLLRQGWHWNGGIFVAQAGVILLAIRRCLPRLYALLQAIDAAWGTAAFPQVLRRAYQAVRAVSFDNGVLAHSRNLIMVEAGFTWSDVGSWDAIGPLWKGRQLRPVTVDDRGSVVIASDRHLVGLLGTSNLIVVQTPDATLICDRRHAATLKRLVGAIRARGLARYL
ncbi:MAG: hypothetical protein HY597_00300 [Candidatus Omnitrophica bacterium]|nr:hypothetical protein [Candidatus Omnitrophota bacterium]